VSPGLRKNHSRYRSNFISFMYLQYQFTLHGRLKRTGGSVLQCGMWLRKYGNCRSKSLNKHLLPPKCLNSVHATRIVAKTHRVCYSEVCIIVIGKRDIKKNFHKGQERKEHNATKEQKKWYQTRNAQKHETTIPNPQSSSTTTLLVILSTTLV